MLQIKNLSVSYGAIEAVKNISLTVNDGEIVSLIGANGAGKTTTLHTITVWFGMPAEQLPYALGDVVDAALNLSVYESARGAQLSGRIIDLHPAGLGAELARQAALVQALRRGIPLTEEQKKQIAPARTDIIAVYRELQSRRWHAEDLQPLCAKLGEEQTGKTLVAVAALEQVGLITAAEKGGAKFWELVPTAGKKNLADAPILKCLEEL